MSFVLGSSPVRLLHLSAGVSDQFEEPAKVGEERDVSRPKIQTLRRCKSFAPAFQQQDSIFVMNIETGALQHVTCCKRN